MGQIWVSALVLGAALSGCLGGFGPGGLPNAKTFKAVCPDAAPGSRGYELTLLPDALLGLCVRAKDSGENFLVSRIEAVSSEGRDPDSGRYVERIDFGEGRDRNLQVHFRKEEERDRFHTVLASLVGAKKARQEIEDRMTGACRQCDQLYTEGHGQRMSGQRIEAAETFGKLCSATDGAATSSGETTKPAHRCRGWILGRSGGRRRPAKRA